ncbi:Dynein regulatory complex protein 1 [Geodia barretti]|nr:Dynein regulatory complex protein 1 [Geodia barretti]
MTDEKDKLVNDFQQELKSQDDQYVKYLKKQAEEVDLVLERMEEQAHTLLRAHRQEMAQIESSFATERETLRDNHKSEWEEAVGKRRSQEAHFLARREERIDKNEAQIQHLRRRNMEDYNRIKIKLETDIQTLQQQIQQMKATYLLNAEKLEYNFQVLKKRDEENTATISLQKRRITRLQDTHNQLSTRLRKQSQAQQSELQALMEEYRKNTEQYRDVQKKARHFQMSDARLFREVWAMNEEKVRELAGEVLEADRVVHKQQLGLEWGEPCEVLSPMDRVLATARSKMSQATIYASQVLSEPDGSVGSEDEGFEGEGDEVSRAPTRGGKEGGKLVDTPRAPTAHVHLSSTVKKVLELLCQEAGFLLDEKLTRLVAPLAKEEQMMMKLDSMFKSLGVHTEEDIRHLVGFFVHEQEEEEEEKEAEENGENKGESQQPKVTDDEAMKGGETRSQSHLKIALIHPNEIPSALRQFVEQRKSTAKPPLLGPRTVGLSLEHKELLGGSFWKGMAGVLPQSHEKVWDALLEGLEQYNSVLVSRYKVKEETHALRNQNTELRLLLQHYMHSRINEELEIPPTLMLPA